MSACVVDTSVAVKWFVPEIHTAHALYWLDNVDELWAPDLLIPEFGNVIWKKTRSAEITIDEGRLILSALRGLGLKYHASFDLIEPACEVAWGLGRTVYDSIYIALAWSLSIKLVTADQRFLHAIKTTTFAKHVVWIEDH